MSTNNKKNIFVKRYKSTVLENIENTTIIKDYKCLSKLHGKLGNSNLDCNEVFY